MSLTSVVYGAVRMTLGKVDGRYPATAEVKVLVPLDPEGETRRGRLGCVSAGRRDAVVLVLIRKYRMSSNLNRVIQELHSLRPNSSTGIQRLLLCQRYKLPASSPALFQRPSFTATVQVEV